jgi:N-methylhydantoinase B
VTAWFLPYGLAGGGSARGTLNVLNPVGEAREMSAKFAVTLRRGDVVLHEQPGVGGHGDPSRATRSAWRRTSATRISRRSSRAARQRVVVDPATLAVDVAADPGGARRPGVR